MLTSEGLISLKQLYTDGTKIEAQAGKYTFVWGKSIRPTNQKCLPSWKNYGITLKTYPMMMTLILNHSSSKKSVKKLR